MRQAAAVRRPRLALASFLAVLFHAASRIEAIRDKAAFGRKAVHAADKGKHAVGVGTLAAHGSMEPHDVLARQARRRPITEFRDEVAAQEDLRCG
jgi:hypothetical protein